MCRNNSAVDDAEDIGFEPREGRVNYIIPLNNVKSKVSFDAVAIAAGGWNCGAQKKKKKVGRRQVGHWRVWCGCLLKESVALFLPSVQTLSIVSLRSIRPSRRVYPGRVTYRFADDTIQPGRHKHDVQSFNTTLFFAIDRETYGRVIATMIIRVSRDAQHNEDQRQYERCVW